MYIYVYIYNYMCMCVCMRMFIYPHFFFQWIFCKTNLNKANQKKKWKIENLKIQKQIYYTIKSIT